MSAHSHTHLHMHPDAAMMLGQPTGIPGYPGIFGEKKYSGKLINLLLKGVILVNHGSMVYIFCDNYS